MYTNESSEGQKEGSEIKISKEADYFKFFWQNFLNNLGIFISFRTYISKFIYVHNNLFQQWFQKVMKTQFYGECC